MIPLGQRLAAELIGRQYASIHLVAPLDFERDVCGECGKRRNDHIAISRRSNSPRTCPTPASDTTYTVAPETVVVGVVEESIEVMRALRTITGYNVRFEIKPADRLRAIINEVYPAPASTASLSDTELVRNAVLEEAARDRASNIFFEYTVDDAGEPHGRVRLDVLGDLRSFTTMPPELYDRLCGMLLRDSMDGAQINRQIGQRGKLQTVVDGRTLNLRVSSFPIFHPENTGLVKIVMRVLRRAEFLPTPASAGLLPEQIALMSEILDDPHCTVLVGGPPGSGKSTTFYMLLGIMPLDELNIYGIEDPPEIYQPRITQTAIKPDQDWTVEEALVEILRQQPHFAFVGEILDPRLAQLFMAANRKSVPIGSTIHAEDALVIVPALRNLDVPSSVIASGMTALASQRLVQHLCTRCRVAVKASTTLVGHLDRMGISDAAEFRVYERGRGCDWCTNGVVGRSAIFEIVTVTPEMREAIIAGDDRALVVAARKNGYVTMLEHALPRIVRGEIAQSALRDFPNSPAHSLALPLNNVTYLPRLLDAARGVLREAKSA